MTREEAIKKLKYLYFNGKALSNSEEAIRMGIEALEEQGKNYFCICRKCFSSYPFEKMFNFCPNCGAKMIEPQESEG